MASVKGGSAPSGRAVAARGPQARVWAALAAVGVLAVCGGGAGVWSLVQAQLQDIRYEVEVVSVHPEDSCVALARSMGPAIVQTLGDVLRAVPFPVDLDPEALKRAPADAEAEVVVEAPREAPAAPEEAPEAPAKGSEAPRPEGLDPDAAPMYASARAPGPGERAHQGQGLLGAATPTQAMLGGARPAPAGGASVSRAGAGVGGAEAPRAPEAAEAAEAAEAPEEAPAGAAPAEEVERAPARGPEDEEEPGCDVRVAMGFKVHNPLPLGMTVDILDVEAHVMDQKLRPDQVLISERALRASGGEPLVGRVEFRFEAEQVMAAAGGMLMRRKVRFKGWARVRVEVLGGVFAQELRVPMEREITASELLRGIEGSVAAQ